jgi:hypothetical protein
MNIWNRQCITILYTAPDDIAYSFGLKRLIIHNGGGTVSLVPWWGGGAEKVCPAKRQTPLYI